MQYLYITYLYLGFIHMDVTVRYLYNGVISSDPPPNLRGRRAVRLGLPGLPFCRTVQLSSRYHIHSYSVTPLIYSLGMASCFASDLLKCQAIHLNVSAQSLDQPTQRENLKHRRLAPLFSLFLLAPKIHTPRCIATLTFPDTATDQVHCNCTATLADLATGLAKDPC